MPGSEFNCWLEIEGRWTRYSTYSPPHRISLNKKIAEVGLTHEPCPFRQATIGNNFLTGWPFFHEIKPFIGIHERTTTAKNMGIHKYHRTSLISYERGWPLACLEGLIKPNQASHQGARWTSTSVSMLRVGLPVLALIIETSAVCCGAVGHSRIFAEDSG
jgi:hypothetical protein